MASMVDADKEWDRQWHLAFNVRLSSADDLPTSAVRAMSAPLEDVVCFAAVMKGCTMALEEQQQPMSSELLLLKRLIHRNKSQHRNSMHLRSLVQLRVACERLAASGLTTIFKVASSVTHDDPAGGSMRGNTMPSRELVDLLISRFVAAAVLSHRAMRAARLVFCANEELVRHTLFAPLAVTCMSLSARILHLATKLREALEESHLRFSALRARAPVNPQSGADALPGPALMAAMLQKAQSLETVPSDFDGQVSCLLRLSGDCADSLLFSASKSPDTAPHGAKGVHGSVAQPAKAAEMAASEVAAGRSGGGGVLRKASGMSVEGAGALGAAAEACGGAAEDEGVSVMMDLGIPLEEKQSTLPASKQKQGSKKSKGKADNVAREAATTMGSLAAAVEPATKGAAATIKSLATATCASGDGRVCASAAADAGAAAPVSVKKKKKNTKLREGKLGLGGSGAAALAALADCSRVRGAAPSVVPPSSSSSSASGAPPSAGAGKVSRTHGSGADDGGGASRGGKGAALMQLLMPAPAMTDDAPGWSVKKPRDQFAASGGAVQEKPKKRKLAELEGRGGKQRREAQDEEHTWRGDAPGKKAAGMEGGRREGNATGGSQPKGALGGRGGGGGAAVTSAPARGKVLGTKEKKGSKGIFADLFPKGGWGD